MIRVLSALIVVTAIACGSGSRDIPTPDTTTTLTGDAGRPDALTSSWSTDGGLSEPPPVHLGSIAPISGPLVGGTEVTLTGSGFGPDVSAHIGGLPLEGLVRVSDTTLVGRTPAGTAGAKDVGVSASGSTSSLTAAFTYVPPPTVTAVKPAVGSVLGGQSVTVSGTGFTNQTRVSIGGTALGNIRVLSATSLQGNTPAGTAGPQDVGVVTEGGSATLTQGFEYAPYPTLVSITPSTGSTAGGTQVTLTGSGFVTGTTAAIDGRSLTQVQLKDRSTLVGIVPTGTVGVKSVRVTNPSGSAYLTDAFTYEPQPLRLSHVEPALGPIAGGTRVTFKGAGFVTGLQLQVGGQAVTSLQLVDEFTVTAVVPAHAEGPVDVVVSNGKQTVWLAGGYEYVVPRAEPPRITHIDPLFAPRVGGKQVTIRGMNFTADTTVTIGGAALKFLKVVDMTTLTGQVPSGVIGHQDVVVRNAQGTTTFVKGFEYYDGTSLGPSTAVVVYPSTFDFGSYAQAACRIPAQSFRMHERTMGAYAAWLDGITLTGTGFTLDPGQNIPSPSYSLEGVAVQPLRFTPSTQGTYEGLVSVKYHDQSGRWGTTFVRLGGRVDAVGENVVSGRATPKLDVLFVVTDGNYPAKTALIQSVPMLVQALESAGVDYRLAVNAGVYTGATMPDDDNNRYVARGMTGAAQRLATMLTKTTTVRGPDRQLIQKAAMVVREQRGMDQTYSGRFLRDDAGLALVFLTDGADPSLDKTVTYLDYIRSQKPLVPRESVSVSVLGGFVDPRHTEWIRDTDGFSGAALGDWNTAVQRWAERATAVGGLFLTASPVTSSLQVTVGGRTLATSEWQYDAALRYVRLVTPAGPGQRVTVRYLGDCPAP